MSSYGFGGDEVKQESSWRYPLGIFLATLVLCAVFLYYYVGPSVDEIGGNVPSPAISEERVALSIGGSAFRIPANYTVYPRDRRGGERDQVAIYMLWPTLSGYTPARRSDFVENEPDTRRIDVTLKKRTSAFSEAERLENLYMPQTIDRRGVRTPYGLIRYDFTQRRKNVPTNGYADTNLFVGKTDDEKIIAMFCFKELTEIDSLDCWREYELSTTVSIIYRFKKAYIQEWRAIDDGVRQFVRDLGPNV